MTRAPLPFPAADESSNLRSCAQAQPARAGAVSPKGKGPVAVSALLVALAGGLAGAARAAEPAFYAIEKSATAATIGAASTASVSVVGKNGWHVNAEAPITLTLVAEPGVALAKGKLTRGDLAASSLERARFDIAFTPSTPGTKKITGDARFVMCQEQACKPVKESVILEVAVADAAGPSSEKDTHPAQAKAQAKAKAKTKAKAKAKASAGASDGAKGESDAAPESW